MTLEEAGQAYVFLVCMCVVKVAVLGKRKETKEANGNIET